MYPSKRKRKRFTRASASEYEKSSFNDTDAMFCMRKRIVILYRLSAGSKEIPLPTSIFGIFRILFKISSDGSSTFASESINEENDLAGFS